MPASSHRALHATRELPTAIDEPPSVESFPEPGEVGVAIDVKSTVACPMRSLTTLGSVPEGSALAKRIGVGWAYRRSRGRFQLPRRWWGSARPFIRCPDVRPRPKGG